METGNSVSFPRQRGGRLNVRTWLVVLLLVISIASGAYNYHQFQERKQMVVQFVTVANQVMSQCAAAQAPPTAEPQKHEKEPFNNAADYSCDFPGTICEKVL